MYLFCCNDQPSFSMTDLFQILITNYYSQSFHFCCETYLFFFFYHFSLFFFFLFLHCQSMALTRRGGRDKNPDPQPLPRFRTGTTKPGLSFSFFFFFFLFSVFFPVMDLLPDFWEISVGMKIFVC